LKGKVAIGNAERFRQKQKEGKKKRDRSTLATEPKKTGLEFGELRRLGVGRGAGSRKAKKEEGLRTAT